MQELQVIDDKKINKIYEMITTDELTRESFEKDLIEATEKYKDYIPTAGTLKDDKAKRAEFNKLIESKNRIRIDTKNLLSETANTWDSYAKSIIDPFATVVSEFDKGIKEIEEHQRQLKIDTVKSYLANKSAEYMLDPRLFDEKALEYVKASDFMADGVTLKKATMKSLDDMVTFEFQKQQEFEKAKSAISGLCAEYGMTDSPYIRQLKDLTLAEAFEQIKADYEFEKQKEEIRQAQERAERESQELLAAQQTKQQERAPKSTGTPNFDPEAGEILDGEQIPQNEQNSLRGAENDLKRYTQKMTLEVYFVDTAEKDRFKAGLSQLGFDFKKNYQVSGYQRIEPLTQAELNEQWGG
ncbi:phage protein [Streptococcus pneumoniae]|nr:phage protein [Streptococcus pneumoniae]